MAQYDRSLILPYTSTLNKSNTKTLCVGLEWCGEKRFKTTIQIIANDTKRSIFLDSVTQWIPLMDMYMSILEYYDGDDSRQEFKKKYTQAIQLGDLAISFPSTDYQRERGVLFQQGNIRLLFMKKTFKSLYYLRPWVEACKKILTHYPTDIFSEFILEYLRKKFGNVRIHKETLQNYLQMTTRDVEKRLLEEIDEFMIEESGYHFTNPCLPLFYNDLLVKNFDQLYDFIYPHTAPNSLNPVEYRGPTPSDYEDYKFKIEE